MAIISRAADPAVEPAESWHPAGRLAFRFACLYGLLFHLPLPFDDLPLPLATWYTRAWHELVPWVGEHLLHLSRPVSVLSNGSGDTTYHYVQLLCIVVIALLGTALWTALARRQQYDVLADGLRTYLRYVLAIVMFGYGVAKVLPTQFPAPSLQRLVQPYGDSSPMGLLWTFMGASPAYTGFGGVLEVLGGLLLLWRRTTALGALLMATVMANVVMLNLCYDVPVKLYSTHLLLTALYLLGPDLGRLLDVLVWHRPTHPVPLDPPAGSPLRRRGVGLLKTALVLYLVGTPAVNGWEAHRRYGEKAVKHPYHGIYEIERVAGGSARTAPLLGDLRRWHRVLFDEWGNLTVQFANGDLSRYGTTHDLAGRTLRLTGHYDRSGDLTVGAVRTAAGRVTLQGRQPETALTIVLRQRPWREVRLVSRGFRWISEAPYNR